jgi:hypothetical protein
LLLLNSKVNNDIHLKNRSGLYLGFLEVLLKEYENITEAFAYKSPTLTYTDRQLSQYASPHSKFVDELVNFYAVSPSYFDALDDRYVEVNYEDKSGLSYSEQLYTKIGTHSASIGTYLADILHLFPDKEEELSTFLLNIVNRGESTKYHKMKVKTIFDAVPSLKMGKRKLTETIDILGKLINI